MADGRTLWYSEDAGFVHRALVVTLGEELGAVVLAVMFALRGEAKLQNDGGRVLSGFSTLSRNAFVNDRNATRQVIERGAAIGLLDDLEIFQDGVRFRCRISGWSADQEKANAAERQRRHRESNGASRSVTASNEDRTGQDRTDNDSLRSSSRREDHDGNDAGNAASAPAPHQPEPDEAPLDAAPEQAPLCHLLADLIVANGGRRPRIGKKWTDAERLLLDRDERDRSEAARLIRWCQANEFWRANILSMPKFREKYDALRLQAQRDASPVRAASVDAETTQAYRRKVEVIEV